MAVIPPTRTATTTATAASPRKDHKADAKINKEDTFITQMGVAGADGKLDSTTAVDGVIKQMYVRKAMVGGEPVVIERSAQIEVPCPMGGTKLIWFSLGNLSEYNDLSSSDKPGYLENMGEKNCFLEAIYHLEAHARHVSGKLEGAERGTAQEKWDRIFLGTASHGVHWKFHREPSAPGTSGKGTLLRFVCNHSDVEFLDGVGKIKSKLERFKDWVNPFHMSDGYYKGLAKCDLAWNTQGSLWWKTKYTTDELSYGIEAMRAGQVLPDGKDPYKPSAAAALANPAWEAKHTEFKTESANLNRLEKDYEDKRAGLVAQHKDYLEANPTLKVEARVLSNEKLNTDLAELKEAYYGADGIVRERFDLLCGIRDELERYAQAAGITQYRFRDDSKKRTDLLEHIGDLAKRLIEGGVIGAIAADDEITLGKTGGGIGLKPLDPGRVSEVVVAPEGPPTIPHTVVVTEG